MRFLDYLVAGEPWSTGVLGTGFDRLWEQTHPCLPFILFKAHTVNSLFKAGEDGGVTPD